MPSAAAVIRHPGAWLDLNSVAVNDAGDVLAFVVSHGVIPDDRCQVTTPSAFLWQGHDGTQKTFGGDVAGRPFGSVPGAAFLVGPSRRPCAAPSSGQHDAPGPYLITPTGTTVQLQWPAGAEGRWVRRICADTLNDRCSFSADGSVRLRPPAPKAPSGHQSRRDVGGILTATSADSRTLWWSLDDGATWNHRTTPLAYRHSPEPSHSGVSQMLVAGTGSNVVLGFYTDTQVDYSLDSGRTWTVRDLPAPPVGYGRPELWVTQSGTLLAIYRSPDGASEVLTRTTDGTWAHTEITPPAGPTAHLELWVHGNVINAHNPHVADPSQAGPWWVSTDAGTHWRRNDLLPVSEATPSR